MVRVADQFQDKDEEEKERRKIEGDQNGGEKSDGHGYVTITEIDDVGSTIHDASSYSVEASCPEDRGYGTDAVCVRIESDVQTRDGEDVSCTSSTEYSDVDDSLEGSELSPWSNDPGLPVCLEQNFDNGVSLPISEAPTFGDVCVKNSTNIHFGNKTFYNGPVTIKQIVYSNPYAVNEKDSNDDDNKSDNLPKERTDSQNSEKFRKEWCNWMSTWRCVALMCAMGSCLVAAVVVSVVFLSQGSDIPPKPSSTTFVNDSSVNIAVLPENKLNFVERVAWGAQPPNKPAPRLNLPVPYVIISQTATVPCSTQSECTYRVRLAQTFDIESVNMTDIASNFMIGGDGYAYVGRGWDSVGEGLYGYNPISIGISFIGTFNTIEPPKLQLRAAQQLIELGVKMEKISPDYKLLGLRQIAKIRNPGDALYSIIQEWPNWTSKP